MIIYVVQLEMDASLRGEYLAWLHEHIAEMLALPEFLAAEIMQRREPPPPMGRWAVEVHYRLPDHTALDAYLARHAPRMRATGLARFGDRVRATRQVLEVL